MQDELRFARHIREYYSERQDVVFHCTDFGFIGYNINGNILTISEFYTESGTNWLSVLRLLRTVVAIGKSRGCDTLVGGTDTLTSSSQDMIKLFKWFKMEHWLTDGSMELWRRSI